MNNLILGEWLVICDRCGFKRHSSEVLEQWDGLIVCGPITGKTCFETRHPLDFVKAKEDKQSVPFVRPQPTDVFVEITPVADTVGTQDNRIPDGTFDNTI